MSDGSRMRIALLVPLVALGGGLGCGANRAGTPGLPPTPTVDTAVADPVDVLNGPDLARNAPLPVTYATWPGDALVTYAQAKDGFSPNLSGLAYEPATDTTPAILWAVQNEPSKLHKLTWSGSGYVRVAAEGWVTGKSLRYPGGQGDPDSEGVTRTDWATPEIYVVAERDNDAKEVPRQSILRYELAGTKGVLEATHEWDLTAELPATAANSGLEGIAWIPDSYLLARGFHDEARQAPYDPAAYPNHGAGLFLVGVDATGAIYAFALDHVDRTFTRVATFSSGQARSVDLTFDRDNGTLWSLCDSKCDGRMTLFDIETDPLAATAGRFVRRALVSPPLPLRGMNNEGFALAPEAECANNRRPVVWSDDGATGGYALRQGAIACGRLY
jgi:hypothetical protein